MLLTIGHLKTDFRVHYVSMHFLQTVLASMNSALQDTHNKTVVQTFKGPDSVRDVKVRVCLCMSGSGSIESFYVSCSFPPWLATTTSSLRATTTEC